MRPCARSSMLSLARCSSGRQSEDFQPGVQHHQRHSGRYRRMVRVMTQGFYGIRDEKAEAFVHFFTAASDQVALRTFDQASENPESQLAKYPRDFVLWRLAYVDQQDGDVEASKERITDGAVVIALRKTSNED